jgi:hypothetical protein
MDSTIRSFNRRFFLAVTLVLAGCAMEVGEAGDDPDTGPDPGADAPPDVEVASQPLSAADAAWWRGLGQSGRNQVILDRAARDINQPVGVQCKPWVQRVVTDASRGAATVPTTAPDPAGWYWQPNAYAIRYYGSISAVRPGWIVQMNLRKADGTISPHTAIVVGVSTSGIFWIESNYDSKHPNTVYTRFQTFADFERQTYINGQARYSLYYIGG